MEGRGRRSQRLHLLNEPKHAGPAESAGGQGKPSSVMPRADKPSPPGRETPALLAAVLPLEKINTLKKKICPRCWETPGTQHQRGLAKQKNHLVAITSFPPPPPSWPSFLTHAYTSSRVCADALRSTHHTCMRSLFHTHPHTYLHTYTHMPSHVCAHIHPHMRTQLCIPYRNCGHAHLHTRHTSSHMHARYFHTCMHPQTSSVHTHSCTNTDPQSSRMYAHLYVHTHPHT